MTESSEILLTLDKGLQVITHLSKVNRAISIGELSKEVNINKSTLFRILKTLQKRGFVFQQDNGDYGLRAEEFTIIVDRFDQNKVLQRTLRPELERLAKLCGETVTLSALVDENIECIDKIDSPQPVHVTQIVGRYSPLHAAASGKAVLAFLPPQKIETLINKKDLKKFTESTIVSAEQLENDLQEIKQKGFSVSHGELDIGISAMAAPIFTNSGSPVGSVSIMGISQKFTDEKIAYLKEILLESARSMSILLKY
ncbi:IclR family transcriptional regulator [Neobacillus kokaensis]|uniref:IclR family transcriptional regulator n=1 Tax=Neobacillus kokaensis TaxID=2759023 RepID=A0ABQ3NAZ1_9BACI|nr:IclR family transcriptional regulator [Neobacillus kokaensis]GHI01077.1 IclR family transcriptional regulator [Neobacillus kokaensis]